MIQTKGWLTETTLFSILLPKTVMGTAACAKGTFRLALATLSP